MPGGQAFLASIRQCQVFNPEPKQDQKQSFRPEAELTEKVIWNPEPGETPEVPCSEPTPLGCRALLE